MGLADLEGFDTPDWSEPLEVADYRALCTREHRIKGMYLQAAVDTAKRVGAELPGTHRYVPFKDYPCEQWIDLAAECAAAAFPRKGLREAMYHFGLGAFPTFRSSVVGKVILAATGTSVDRTLSAGKRAYSVLLTRGTCEPTVEPGRALWELRDVVTFADSFHVGAVRGVLDAFAAEGSVQIRRRSLADVDLLVTWR